MKHITRIKEIDGRYYPQVMFKLFWIIPTGWWRNCADICFDVILGQYIGTVWYKTKQEAEHYIKFEINDNK